MAYIILELVVIGIHDTDMKYCDENGSLIIKVSTCILGISYIGVGLKLSKKVLKKVKEEVLLHPENYF